MIVHLSPKRALRDHCCPFGYTARGQTALECFVRIPTRAQPHRLKGVNQSVSQPNTLPSRLRRPQFALFCSPTTKTIPISAAGRGECDAAPIESLHTHVGSSAAASPQAPPAFQASDSKYHFAITATSDSHSFTSVLGENRVS